ncbi:uncharacterized protein AMSG_03039 [Thecamonas trahens ATCC 50062]|uniref:Uncharacterized protein n=1 Tax=Thecamonas trahens ATCC 50062 TaxID=461836 RepID=A0A0L0D2R7_THETB|nr:hypothetical protein AMSG_03039 [Thecamonas trahens ATCC 50062]KNC46602.1 hypothetical protein AMSG_03039 [Thecamonas trahens ATCC 50062]|eukprot:XP_013760377.1 hypothetical protein AMSG_03039 [Thecamonas trahens ATCC 50062]
MSKIGNLMGMIKRGFACFESLGCGACKKCKGPSSFFKSPFPTPKQPEVKNTGMIAIKIHHSSGNWQVTGINRYYDEVATNKRFKKGYDLIPESFEFL